MLRTGYRHAMNARVDLNNGDLRDYPGLPVTYPVVALSKYCP